eukprot:RCo007738
MDCWWLSQGAELVKQLDQDIGKERDVIRVLQAELCCKNCRIGDLMKQIKGLVAEAAQFREEKRACLESYLQLKRACSGKVNLRERAQWSFWEAKYTALRDRYMNKESECERLRRCIEQMEESSMQSASPRVSQTQHRPQPAPQVKFQVAETFDSSIPKRTEATRNEPSFTTAAAGLPVAAGAAPELSSSQLETSSSGSFTEQGDSGRLAEFEVSFQRYKECTMAALRVELQHLMLLLCDDDLAAVEHSRAQHVGLRQVSSREAFEVELAQWVDKLADGIIALKKRLALPAFREGWPEGLLPFEVFEAGGPSHSHLGSADLHMAEAAPLQGTRRDGDLFPHSQQPTFSEGGDAAEWRAGPLSGPRSLALDPAVVLPGEFREDPRAEEDPKDQSQARGRHPHEGEEPPRPRQPTLLHVPSLRVGSLDMAVSPGARSVLSSAPISPQALLANSRPVLQSPAVSRGLYADPGHSGSGSGGRGSDGYMGGAVGGQRLWYNGSSSSSSSSAAEGAHHSGLPRFGRHFGGREQPWEGGSHSESTL